MSPTQRLLEFAGADHTLPEQVRADTARLLADTLAVGAAGANAPGADAILAAARAMGSGAEARLIGTDERLPAPAAAFVNGYRIHCLEWDAVHEPAVVHALSTVVAALGAAIDRKGGCDPEEALAALAIGVDVAAGLGLAASSGLTFFRPATAGVMGAALAVARIDGAPLADTLGIAYSSAAGTMQAHVEGLATLPFQIANAARAAVTASDLARAGFPGPKHPLEGEFGYFALFEDGDLSRYTDRLGVVWRISEVSVKPFPSGRASHGALGKLEELALDPEAVERIELACPPLIRRLVSRPYQPDMTPAYARLCLQWLGSLMLTDGRIDPRRFTAEHMADPALAALAQRFVLVPDGNENPNALFPQALVVTLKDGSQERHEIAATLGSPANPLSPQQAQHRLALARELAPPDADPRIFDDPLSYFTKAL
ncbi:MmgE/PrpD family protein [Altererythrobacter arenosus]|uniref:MmgE/PrpD family protein n=1 Tax=Altererythrobacter arenosus TaxID=3032592 RepID=A0ABY8FQ40_9SPHN|nr:MmgE/PrpD family protein [Altererythrobacter sp. CAU 1644]WFL76375.1 MmgE/PrpD family protein [Altererythrobacter sp. CAU 1644]